MTIRCIVLHAKVVPHLVGHCCGHHCRVRTVLHAHSAGVLVRADGTLQGLAHHTAGEVLLGQQLGIIVRMIQHQLGATVVQKISQCQVAVAGELDFVALVPNHHTHQRHKYIQWDIELTVGKINRLDLLFHKRSFKRKYHLPH